MYFPYYVYFEQVLSSLASLDMITFNVPIGFDVAPLITPHTSIPMLNEEDLHYVIYINVFIKLEEKQEQLHIIIIIYHLSIKSCVID